MTLYIFQCSKLHFRTGVTKEIGGANLPFSVCQGGNWKFWKSIQVNEFDTHLIGAISFNKIVESIEIDGYYINDVSFEFKETD